MEYLNFLILPLYWVLFKIHGRLVKVETTMKYHCEDRKKL